VDEQQSID